MLAVLGTTPLPLLEQGFGPELVEGRPLWSDDVPNDPRFESPLFRRYRHQSGLIIPLVLDGKVSGAFYLVWWRDRRRFDASELGALQIVGRQVGMLLQNARLYQALEGRAARLRTLVQLNQLISSSLETGEVLRGIARAAAEIMKVDVVSFWIVDLVERTLTVRAFSDELMGEDFPVQVVGFDRGGVGWVATHRQALGVPDVFADGRFVGLDWWARRGLRSFYGVPMVYQGALIGVLALNGRRPFVFTEDDLSLLDHFVIQAAVAVQNAALFQEAESRKTQLEQVFASTSDGILVLDLSGRITALNRRGGEVLHVLPAEVMGRPLARLVEKLGGRSTWETQGGPPIDSLAEGRVPQVTSGDLEMATPPRRILRWLVTPTLDIAGAPRGLTVTLRDVTHERGVERMKTELVSIVSHELRTPLASIKGALHLLLSEPASGLDDTQQQLLDISLKNTDRLIRLINDMLDVSKIEAGRIELQLEPHRVSEFVTLAISGIRAFAESRRVTIARELETNLPEVNVDLDRMVQVLTNLLSNAVKFSPEGGQVRVSARLGRAGPEAGETVEISVKDEGRGISAEDIPRLFEKFRQLDSTTVREVEGTGLGLAICRGLVEEHGGRISVASAPGAGATFVVSLPSAAEPSRTPPPAAGAPAGPTVLVVDDEPELRSVLRSHLERNGYRVLEAGRALEALEIARAEHPDLITMDVGLPDLDGLEAIRLLRQWEDTREIPVVVITGSPGQEINKAELRHLARPFDESRLLERVREALASRSPSSEPTILVVDDETDVREMLADTLTEAGFRVMTAADGAAALQALRATLPDLVLLDLMMPGMDGYEALRALRGAPETRDLPVVILTGVDSASERERAMAAGATVYLRKPVLAKELVQTIRASLAGTRGE
jgi:signal transduction histidine kinase/DNA-binding response OmpR family regulator/putative methionine-R-sulfoxide reductase with GAF domain